jgi:hypothetical protein
METWKKFAIIFAIVIVIVVFVTLLAVDFQGWGKALGKSGGPFFNGLYNIGAMLPKFALSGGYNLILFYLIIVFACLITAYLVWHFDLGYKINGQKPTAASIQNYNAQREPEEPETLAGAGKA